MAAPSGCPATARTSSIRRAGSGRRATRDRITSSSVAPRPGRSPAADRASREIHSGEPEAHELGEKEGTAAGFARDLLDSARARRRRGARPSAPAPRRSTGPPARGRGPRGRRRARTPEESCGGRGSSPPLRCDSRRPGAATGGRGGRKISARSAALSTSPHCRSSRKRTTSCCSASREKSSRSAPKARRRCSCESGISRTRRRAPAIDSTRRSTGKRRASARTSRGRTSRACSAGKLLQELAQGVDEAVERLVGDRLALVAASREDDGVAASSQLFEKVTGQRRLAGSGRAVEAHDDGAPVAGRAEGRSAELRAARPGRRKGRRPGTSGAPRRARRSPPGSRRAARGSPPRPGGPRSGPGAAGHGRARSGPRAPSATRSRGAGSLGVPLVPHHLDEAAGERPAAGERLEEHDAEAVPVRRPRDTDRPAPCSGDM